MNKRVRRYPLPSKQTKWISLIIISKIESAQISTLYWIATNLPAAHLYWIPSSSAGCISNTESAKISTLYWIASSSPLLDSQ